MGTFASRDILAGMTKPRIAVRPQSGRYESLEKAVIEGGGQLCSPAEAEGLIWADAHAPELMPEILAACPSLRWVSLPFAGIERYVDYLDPTITWTCAKGVYARPVAEHVLTLGLAGLRGLSTYARASSWEGPEGHNLLGGKVTIFGAGGITEELLKLLAPFECEVTVVRRQPTAMAGASRTVALKDRLEAIRGADLVVLALSLTEETVGVMGSAEFEAMESHAWLVNVARGPHVQTDALLHALRSDSIGGAALDVTDPEPLPDGHDLWTHRRVIITPHIANTPEMGIPLLAKHVSENVKRFEEGRPLDGLVSVEAGY